MKNNINILYIDDNLDTHISAYLDDFCDNYSTSIIGSSAILESEDFEYTKEMTYEELLNSHSAQNADIFLIDSQLFTNKQKVNFIKGEELQLIIQKIYPFKEFIIISQDNYDKKCCPIKNIISKYNNATHESVTAEDYYKTILNPLLSKAIERVCSSRNIMEQMKTKKSVNKFFIDKIENSMLGIVKYDELTESNMDEFVESIKRLERALRDE